MARVRSSRNSGSRGTSGRGERALRVKVKSKGQTNSSRRWLERQLNDPYVAAAQRDGWRSRAAYKLLEINEKHPFLKPGAAIVDLGAAPGGWCQVAAEKVKSVEGRGQVIAIDILEMDQLAGADVLHLDFMDDDAPDRLRALLKDGAADAVLSDMAAATTGHSSTDHLRIMMLAEAAAHFAIEVLKPGGTFLAKVFQGGTERQLLDLLKRRFEIVRHIKPPASRKDSKELYVLATGFRAAPSASGTHDAE